MPEQSPVDQEKVDDLSKQISIWLQTKMYGVDVRTALAWTVEHFSALHYDMNELVEKVIEEMRKLAEKWEKEAKDLKETWVNTTQELKDTWDNTTEELRNNWSIEVNRLSNSWQTILDSWEDIVSQATTDTEIIESRINHDQKMFKTLKSRLDHDFNVIEEALEKQKQANELKWDYLFFSGTEEDWNSLPVEEQQKYQFAGVTD